MNDLKLKPTNLFRMKLFKTLSAVAVVRAQVPDFSDLNALFASLTENLSVPGAPAEEVDAARYVVATTTNTPPLTTTTPTTTTTQATGEGCWKCDAMTFATCATQGQWQQCSPDQTAGDYGVCFLELRETNQLMTQLCTGCKSRNACYNLRRQNFVGSSGSNLSRFHDQCKPEWKLQVSILGNQKLINRFCLKLLFHRFKSMLKCTLTTINSFNFSVPTVVTELNNPFAVLASKCAQTVPQMDLVDSASVVWRSEPSMI